MSHFQVLNCIQVFAATLNSCLPSQKNFQGHWFLSFYAVLNNMWHSTYCRYDKLINYSLQPRNRAKLINLSKVTFGFLHLPNLVWKCSVVQNLKEGLILDTNKTIRRVTVVNISLFKYNLNYRDSLL